VEESFVSLPVSKGCEPRSGRLRAVFAAEGAIARVRGLRGGLVGLLALLGAPAWVALIWPAALSRDGRALVAAVWAVALAGVVLLLIRESWWRRQRARHIAALGPLPVLRSRPAQGQACESPSADED
jgi:hypothetical protein